MTQSKRMRSFLAGLLAPLLVATAFAREPALKPTPEQEESFQVAGEHPRLFLTSRRLRLLRRERERQSLRWQQFERLMAGGASMPEPGFALALYFQVAGQEDAGRRAVQWVLANPADLRQAALVFDWCQPVMTPEQAATLLGRLEEVLSRPARPGIWEARDRTLAAIALADRAPRASERELERVVRRWWRGEVVPALERGRDVVSRAETYALLELLHAVADNLLIDLRESSRVYFRQLPVVELLSYYPAAFPAAENDYHIPASKSGRPDLQLAVLARAADLALVAYDTNARENQFLQGWLMHDRFLMRGALGAPYEFLWANPYLPGLSYYNASLFIHDSLLGRLFVRSSWDDDAVWLGYFSGELQTFGGGQPKVVKSRDTAIWVGTAAVFAASSPTFLQVSQPAQAVLIVGLKPSAAYQVEIDDRELREELTDPGGILEFRFPESFRGGIALREAAPAP
ncbi:MAG: hypothetical protein ABSD27_07220 [Bryobacteraceae bacterium]|jgi:hypothetical protein